jgi:uncharacterized membrane protein (UPF0136 family)
MSEWAPLVFIRDSRFGMPAVQSVHLVGLTLLLATVFLLDIRLADFGLREWPLPRVEKQLRRWTIAGLVAVVLSGALIFVATPAKYLASNPFRVKMAMLALAIVVQFVFIRRLATREDQPNRAVNVVVAAVSLTLWFGVGWAGRAIAFVP